jgi:hypothetical protein
MGSLSDLDRAIESLKRCEYLKESEVKALCYKAREILVDEGNVQRVDAPVTVSLAQRQPTTAGPSGQHSSWRPHSGRTRQRARRGAEVATHRSTGRRDTRPAAIAAARPASAGWLAPPRPQQAASCGDAPVLATPRSGVHVTQAPLLLILHEDCVGCC